MLMYKVIKLEEAMNDGLYFVLNQGFVKAWLVEKGEKTRISKSYFEERLEIGMTQVIAVDDISNIQLLNYNKDTVLFVLAQGEYYIPDNNGELHKINFDGE